MAIRYAIENGRSSVTLVHKGNIMKYTEGAFRDWGYEVAKEEFGEYCITESELWDVFGGKQPEGKIVVKDRIADNMFQQILTRTDEYDVIALPNLNGDYLSDAAAALIGGLGIAPGSNIGDGIGVFEPVHGSAPDIAGKGIANPIGQIWSGVMMLDHLGEQTAANAVMAAIEELLASPEGVRTPDIGGNGSCRDVGEDIARIVAGA